MSLDSVLNEVFAERQRQDSLWGEQNHQDGTGDHYGYRERSARFACETAVLHGRVTYAHIFDEEAAEVMAAPSKDQLRGELIQCAAVCIAWVEKLDREAGK